MKEEENEVFKLNTTMYTYFLFTDKQMLLL